ncbi:MAG: hypothetical protein ABIH11_02670 [Candidatus Altiarchaeota archaeon]
MFAVLALVALTLAGTVTAAISAATGMISARSAICTILANIRMLLSFIAAAVAAVVITLQGIKWAGSAEDPGARKQAKQGIIHAIVGLVIVLAAVWIVTMIFTGDQCDDL